MPEPNLPPLLVYDSETAPPPVGAEPGQVVLIDALRDRIPELPRAKRERLVDVFGILPEHSYTLVVSAGAQYQSSPAMHISLFLSALFAAPNYEMIKVTAHVKHKPMSVNDSPPTQ